MTSRDTILQRIRSEVSKGPRVEPPPVAEVWPRENPDVRHDGRPIRDRN